MNEAVTPNTPGLIRLARAELAQTRANLCSHGVPVAVCHDHRTDDSKGGYVPKAMSDDLCNHWNDRLPNGMALRPVRCTRTAGHSGLHLCGDTSWSEALGVRMEDAAATDQPDQEDA